MDSSTSVGRDGFNREKGFVKSLAKYFNVSPGKSRAAVVAYSNFARTILKFTDYQSETDFNDKLDTEPWFGGIRRIDRALEAASTLLSQARPNVPKVVVLVTAGQQTTSAGARPMGEAARPLKNMGAKTVVVTVGIEADLKIFLPVVNSISDLFGVKLFDELRYEVQPIVNQVVDHFGELNELLSMSLTVQSSLAFTKYSQRQPVLRKLATYRIPSRAGFNCSLLIFFLSRRNRLCIELIFL